MIRCRGRDSVELGVAPSRISGHLSARIQYQSQKMDSLWLKALIKALVLPPTGLLLLAALGLGIQTRFPRVGRTTTTLGVLGLLALSIPIVADSLVRLLDRSLPFDSQRASGVQAIVVLGGGVRRDAPEFGGDTLSTLTLERVRYGARIARLTGLPILVSGGSVLGGTPEGTLMRAALESEFGVPVRWVEARSRTTRENAAFSAAILRKEGIQRVALVTHGFDLLRATAEFAAEGIETVGAPTVIRVGRDETVLDYLPSMAGLRTSYYATYELLANLVRLANGR